MSRHPKTQLTWILLSCEHVRVPVCTHSQWLYSSEVLGLKAEAEPDLASPMALYLLVNHAAATLRSLLLLALLLAPLKSAKSHVALVSLVEGGLYHEGALSRWRVSFLNR